MKRPSWPDPGQPAFVNAVAVVETTLQPVELLALLHGVETAFGRMRSAPNAPRTLDIDLLDYDGRVTGDGLTLPHPRMADRGFVLVPLAEVAPGLAPPGDGAGGGGTPGGAAATEQAPSKNWLEQRALFCYSRPNP